MLNDDAKNAIVEYNDEILDGIKREIFDLASRYPADVERIVLLGAVLNEVKGHFSSWKEKRRKEENIR